MKRKNPDLECDKFYDFIETQATIECTAKNCKSIIGSDDEIGVAVDAYNEGWKATSYNVYCPKCAKKKLKGK